MTRQWLVDAARPIARERDLKVLHITRDDLRGSTIKPDETRTRHLGGEDSHAHDQLGGDMALEHELATIAHLQAVRGDVRLVAGLVPVKQDADPVTAAPAAGAHGTARLNSGPKRLAHAGGHHGIAKGHDRAVDICKNEPHSTAPSKKGPAHSTPWNAPAIRSY